ncbi:hypothetical protein BY996DRAFT_8693058, partial [Phakopsora pachyrhizi]
IVKKRLHFLLGDIQVKQKRIYLQVFILHRLPSSQVIIKSITSSYSPLELALIKANLLILIIISSFDYCRSQGSF